MFNSSVLDVAVGIVFTFLTVSLVCGLLTETWATIAAGRANTLLAGVQALVNDPQIPPDWRRRSTSIRWSAPRDSGTATTVGCTASNIPSYIAPLHFAAGNGRGHEI